MAADKARVREPTKDSKVSKVSKAEQPDRSALDRAARIETAALELLERGGPDAVTTRAVAEAAGTQPMAIYRMYGDMDGLLDAVLERGFDTYLDAKRNRPRLDDPVDDLRAGWDLNVGFGLEHPHLYTAMHSSPDPSRVPAAVAKGALILDEMVERVAKAGRLRTSVRQAADMIRAAGVGTTLSLIATDPDRRDPELSTRLREAVLAAVTTEAPAEPPDRARHAAALAATVDDGPAVLTDAESLLLREWLARLSSPPPTPTD
ncbi:MAG TPA: TetR/AcrR family transcriptional regulator [Acidimicrobiales bacterium]